MFLMQEEIAQHDTTKAEVWELIQTLVSGQVSPGRILELYYWSLEPGAVEMLRSFLALSNKDRALLQAFFGSVDARSISIEACGSEKITLSSPDNDDRLTVTR